MPLTCAPPPVIATGLLQCGKNRGPATGAIRSTKYVYKASANVYKTACAVRKEMA